MLQEIWDWLTSSAGGGVGVLLHILGTASVVGGAAYGWFRHSLRHSGAVIARLREDLERRTEQLDRSLQKERQLEISCAEATGRLIETAAVKVAREIRRATIGLLITLRATGSNMKESPYRLF
jgi:hypothetical protein